MISFNLFRKLFLLPVLMFLFCSGVSAYHLFIKVGLYYPGADGTESRYLSILQKDKNKVIKKIWSHLFLSKNIDLKIINRLHGVVIKDNDPLYNKIIKLVYERHYAQNKMDDWHEYAQNQMDSWYDDPNHDPMVLVDEEFEKFRVMEENSEKELIQIITNL